MDERLALLAELLSYPGERTQDAIRTLLDRDPHPYTEAALAPLEERFGSTEALQELYTNTFDLQPACAPYFGHHLLGEESPLRGPLLARLAEIYAAHGFTPREELGDHLAEVLRFLAVAPPGPERDDLVRDGLLPALRRMIDGFEAEANPYRDVLALVERTLGETVPDAAARPATPERRAAP